MLQIYSVSVSVFLGGNKPSRTGDVRGDISVYFSCDPDISSRLVGFFISLLIPYYFVCVCSCRSFHVNCLTSRTLCSG